MFALYIVILEKGVSWSCKVAQRVTQRSPPGPAFSDLPPLRGE